MESMDQQVYTTIHFTEQSLNLFLMTDTLIASHKMPQVGSRQRDFVDMVRADPQLVSHNTKFLRVMFMIT